MLDVGTYLKGGRWHLDARLATGGVSTVFAATHRNGSRAAIKVLDGSFTEDEDMRRRFLREGYAANKVGHAGVVRVLDDDVTEDGHAYLVMELLDGEPLDRRRVRLGGKLALAEALDIADQLLDVLAAAHDHGIVHRDIKPGNLFLTTKGQLKVLDFGFAKIKEAASGESTAVGTLLGTPGFLAPERARAEAGEADARADIWSAGATIFTLLSGELVHEKSTSVGVLVATAQQPARSLAVVAPELPSDLIAAIDRALAFEKTDRWASARDMQRAIRDVTRVEDLTEAQAPPVLSAIVTSPAQTQRVRAVAAPPTDVPEDAVRPTIPVPKPQPSKRRTDRPVPRVYDEVDVAEGGGKGGTALMPASRPWIAAAPRIASAPPLQQPAPPSALRRPATRPSSSPASRRRPSRARGILWLFVGAALALLGIAIGAAALLGPSH